MEQNQTISKFSINPGLMLGGVLILVSVITYIIGLNPVDDSWIGWISYAVMAFAFFYFQKDYRDNYNGGFLSLGEAVKLGVTIAVIAGILSAIYNIIFMLYIEPDFVDKMLMKVEEQMLETNPDMTQAQVDMALGMTSKMMSPMISVPLAIVGSAISGLILSLGTGFFNKKNNPNF
ncbi:MAG: DUF4199 domain-containing protein [Flavobacteriales bacterium]|nr:DUF4199 domain-containing protein [Flavobacteriales bacterium]